MFAHLEPLEGFLLSSGDVSLFLRIGSDFNDNYYEYKIPLEPTPTGSGMVNDPYLIWPEANNIDLNFADLQNLKIVRNQTSKLL